ncbi:MAG: DoxX family membrane protein [Candidatus Veblenbacteria bacterium]|nr:DoxX family membrane protein [Candidatus Veblenbacteria bacterium]
MLVRLSFRLRPYLPLALRLGLGFVFFWSGLSKLVSPESAVGVCTNRAEAIDLVSTFGWLPFDPELFVLAQSVLELVLGAALLLGFLVPLASAVAVAVFLLFFFLLDFSLIWKNIGLLGASLALLASEADKFSLDSWLKRYRKPEQV